MGSQYWPASFFTQGSGLPGVSSFPVLASDPDAAAYVDLVQKYDEAELESDVQSAINAFVVSLKTSNIWSNIAHLQLLVGARTIEAISVPLKGTAPTLYGFDQSNYNRRTGLQGDGAFSYINTNISMSSILAADGKYVIARVARATNLNSSYIGANPGSRLASTNAGIEIGMGGTSTSSNLQLLQRANTSATNTLRHDSDGVYGICKFPGAGHAIVYPSLTATNSSPLNTTVSNLDIFVLARNTNRSATNFSNGRVGLYSLGDYTSGANTDLVNFRSAINTLFSSLATASLTT